MWRRKDIVPESFIYKKKIRGLKHLRTLDIGTLTLDFVEK